MHRILSLVWLAHGQHEAALKAIKRALELDEKNLLVQHTAGVVKFFTCYPAAILPRQLLAPGEPVTRDLLTLDTERRRYLDESAGHFRKALDALDGPCASVEIHEFWHFVSLAINPDRRDDSRVVGGDLLRRTEPIDYVVQWSRMYGLNIHLEWLAGAKVAIEAGTDRPAQRFLTGWLMLEDRNHDAAAKLLMNASPDETDNERLQRKMLLSRALLEQREFKAAIQALEGESGVDVQRVVDTIRRDENERPVRSEEALNAVVLLDECTSAARKGDWQKVASNAPRLLRDLYVPAAVRLALAGFFNTKRYEDVLKAYTKTLLRGLV